MPLDKSSRKSSSNSKLKAIIPYMRRQLAKYAIYSKKKKTNIIP